MPQRMRYPHTSVQTREWLGVTRDWQGATWHWQAPNSGSEEARVSSCGPPGFPFVVRPHSKHAHDTIPSVDLIDHTMLEIDSPVVRSHEVSHQFLEWRRRLKGILGKDIK